MPGAVTRNRAGAAERMPPLAPAGAYPTGDLLIWDQAGAAPAFL